MEIIAKHKDGTYLLSASDSEIRAMKMATTGTSENPELGDKIPGIDYASTITKIKTLSDDSSYKNLVSEVDRFNKAFDRLDVIVNSAKEIETK